MFTVIADATSSITVESLTSTVLFTVLGIVIMVLALMFINIVFRLNMKHELINENNTAYGIMIAGMAIAIALIVAGTILS